MRLLLLVPVMAALTSAEPSHAQQPVNEPAPAAAQAAASPDDSAAEPQSSSPEDSEEPPPPDVPLAPDTLGGHLGVAAGAGLAVPFGRLQSGLLQSRRVGPGLALTVSAAYGVSRAVAIGLWGDMQSLSHGTACSSCSGTGFGVGALAFYHLVQGVRFDPWLAAGVGWRTLTVASDAPDATYSGPELLRLLVGGDWYASSLIALGPALELSTGTYTSRPGDAGSAREYWQFQTTLRVTLDVPGK